MCVRAARSTMKCDFSDLSGLVRCVRAPGSFVDGGGSEEDKGVQTQRSAAYYALLARLLQLARALWLRLDARSLTTAVQCLLHSTDYFCYVFSMLGAEIRKPACAFLC